jgi:hypothetical protein
MRRPPSIVPRGDDHDMYLVVDDLGRLDRVWREADCLLQIEPICPIGDLIV